MFFELMIGGIVLIVMALCKLLFPFALIYFAYYLFVKKGKK